VAAARLGNRTAVETLLRRHYDRCYAICRRLIGDDQDARAAAQTAMIAIAESIADSGNASSFSIWAYRVTVVAAQDELARRNELPPPYSTRALADQAELHARLERQPIGAEAGGGPTGAGAAGHAGRVPLDQLLEEVADEYRAAAVLRDMLNMAYPQIAEILGIPVSSVSLRIAQGRSALAHALAGTGGPATSDNDSIGPHRYGHPSVLELSWFLDDFLSHPEGAWAATHLSTCGPCRRELDELKSARHAIAGAGFPLATLAARDVAVVTALSFTPRAVRELETLALSPLDEPATPSFAAGGAEKAPAEIHIIKRRPATPAGFRTEPAVLAGLGRTASEATTVGSMRTPRPSVPPNVVRRHRRVGVAARAAVGVVILGALGGTLLAVVPSHHRPLSATNTTAARVTTTSSHVAILPSRSTPTTVPKAGTAPAPPASALALQLRPQLGSASCTKLVRHLESVNGVLVVTNPPATDAAVMATPQSTAQAPSCINVGSAFATAWSGDVTHVSIAPAGSASTSSSSSASSGPAYDVVIEVSPGAVTDAKDLSRAEAGLATTAVIAQGIDLGTATLAKGPVITLLVSQSVATFLNQQLRPS